MGDRVTFSARIAPRFEHSYEALQVGDRIVVGGCPLSSESTVEVGADAAVARCAQKLADVVCVVGDGFEGGFGDLLVGWHFALPVGIEHPGIEGSRDDSR